MGLGHNASHQPIMVKDAIMIMLMALWCGTPTVI